MAEWFKAVDLRPTISGFAGSNPAVCKKNIYKNYIFYNFYKIISNNIIMSNVKITSDINKNLNVNHSVFCDNINGNNLNVNVVNTNNINVTDDVYINSHIYTPVGSILTYSGVSAPAGWLLCDGSEVSKATYPRLFSVIGTLYGTAGDSSNNFVLPNLADRLPVGKSGSNSIGNVGGASSVTLSVSNLPSHTHTGTVDSAGSHTHGITDPGHTHTTQDAYFAEYNGSVGPRGFTGSNNGIDNDNQLYVRTVTSSTSTTGISVNSASDHTHTFTTGSTGGGNSIDIRNKYIVLNYIIRY